MKRYNGKAYVFNIQHYSLHDGPGIRTIVFLKGCPLRCRWCCNPESQNPEREISYVESKCIGLKECGFCKSVAPEGAIDFVGDKAVISLEKCRGLTELSEVCPSKAIKTEGRAYEINELLDIVERDSVFYAHGKGGLTVSGGEPLMSGNFLTELLTEAKRRRLNTAMETCGYGSYEVLFKAAGLLDSIMFDIKTLDPVKHREYTGRDNSLIISNLKRLCKDLPTVLKRVRTPVIPGFNDTEEDILKIAAFVKDKPNTEYELLPYHSLGRGKYKALGRLYPMGDLKLDNERFDKIKASTDKFLNTRKGLI